MPLFDLKESQVDRIVRKIKRRFGVGIATIVELMLNGEPFFLGSDVNITKLGEAAIEVAEDPVVLAASGLETAEILAILVAAAPEIAAVTAVAVAAAGVELLRERYFSGGGERAVQVATGEEDVVIDVNPVTGTRSFSISQGLEQPEEEPLLRRRRPEQKMSEVPLENMKPEVETPKPERDPEVGGLAILSAILASAAVGIGSGNLFYIDLIKLKNIEESTRKSADARVWVDILRQITAYLWKLVRIPESQRQFSFGDLASVQLALGQKVFNFKNEAYKAYAGRTTTINGVRVPLQLLIDTRTSLQAIVPSIPEYQLVLVSAGIFNVLASDFNKLDRDTDLERNQMSYLAILRKNIVNKIRTYDENAVIELPITPVEQPLPEETTNVARKSDVPEKKVPALPNKANSVNLKSSEIEEFPKPETEAPDTLTTQKPEQKTNLLPETELELPPTSMPPPNFPKQPRKRKPATLEPDSKKMRYAPLVLIPLAALSIPFIIK